MYICIYLYIYICVYSEVAGRGVQSKKRLVVYLERE